MCGRKPVYETFVSVIFCVDSNFEFFLLISQSCYAHRCIMDIIKMTVYVSDQILKYCISWSNFEIKNKIENMIFDQSLKLKDF